MNATDDVAYAGHWLAVARGDLATAMTIIGAPALPPRLAAELAQHAAEKALKALIALDGTEPPHSHDLVRLRAMLPDSVAIQGLSVDLEALTDVYLGARYPDPAEAPITRALARRLVDDAAAVVEAITASLVSAGVDVAEL